jgi:hypothetical protein
MAGSGRVKIGGKSGISEFSVVFAILKSQLKSKGKWLAQEGRNRGFSGFWHFFAFFVLFTVLKNRLKSKGKWLGRKSRIGGKSVFWRLFAFFLCFLRFLRF